MFKRKICILYVCIFLFTSICSAAFKDSVKICDLRCETPGNYIFTDNATPAFSWKLAANMNDVFQSAYQISVSSDSSELTTQHATVWNSGKIFSDRSVNVLYKGKSLAGNTRYFWKVIVWTNHQAKPVESKIASFQTGFFNRSDWKAKWIGLDTFFSPDKPHDVESKLSARYFRKQFNIKNDIRRATVYFSGLGVSELYINGKKIGHAELSPTPSDYRKHVYYNAYDVSDFFTKGENTIGAIVGNGLFFSMRQGVPGEWQDGIPVIQNFGYPKMILQLEIEYKDGNKQTVISDSSWKVTSDGPIRWNNEYDGEVYDYSKEMTDWNNNTYDDSKWLSAQLTAAPSGILLHQRNPDMKVMDTVHPISMHKTSDGRYIFDLGENIAGRVNIHFHTKPDASIVLRYAERPDSAGNLYTTNLRSAKAKDSIFTGNKNTVAWHSSFVYHGFRYVEISGADHLSKDNLEGQIIYDDMQSLGSFSCSDSTLNNIYKAAYRTISDNYKGIPVDCPQRDERMGWLGDRSTNCTGESFLFDNQYLYAKWANDIADAQKENGSLPDIAPGFWPNFYSDNMTWPSAYLFVSDMLNKQFGDDRSIKTHYPSMKKWLKYMLRFMTEDSLVERDNYGDWCVPPESPEIIVSKDTTRNAPKSFIGAVYTVKCLEIMARFASVANELQDSIADIALKDRMIKAINKKYFNTQKGYYANNTVTANLLALAFDIAPQERRKDIIDNIIKVSSEKYNDHVSTGLIGNQWLMRGFTDNGYGNIAYKIATNTTYPSWGYMLKNGATTIWELWNGNTANPAMNSGNHVMLLGDLVIWYYENLAAIKSIAPGFKKIEMKPIVNIPLNYVNASHISQYGKISSNWKKSGNRFYWDITLPPNCSAAVYVPAAAKNKIVFNGENHFLKEEKGYFIYAIGNGSYHISSLLN